jgi:hypothetical protein
MLLTPSQQALLGLVALAYVALLFFIDRGLLTRPRPRLLFRYAALAGTTALVFAGITRFIDDNALATDYAKAAIATAAAAAVFYEQHRERQRRPIAERWKKFGGVTLGVMGLVAYCHGFRFGSEPYYYHRHDTYHYYMGAKYFKELGYDDLYKCALIAQDQLGTVTFHDDATDQTFRIDNTKEARHPDRKIRRLGSDNMIVYAAPFLEHPEACTDHFTPERWEAFKQDVLYFRGVAGKGYFEEMLRDHGYNPPPGWMILGRFFAELHPASVRYLQLLALIDVVFILGAFAALWWAFGWRVAAVGAIFWGCQSSAPFYWTGGAFLRQDWFFFLVLSPCLLRKNYPKLAGASLVYAGLLRIFPGLVVVGLLVPVGWQLFRHRRLDRKQTQMLIGGTAAAALIIPLSVAVAGPASYPEFYRHTLQIHDRTPLTNHMGLRVLIGHDIKAQVVEQVGTAIAPFADRVLGPATAGKIGDVFHYKEAASKASGRMRFTKDMRLADPFETWKNMRNERYDRYKWVAYGIIAAILAFFVYVHRRIKSLWIAMCLGQVFIILLSQLTCYYYSFMVLTAPLTRVRRDIEVPLFGLAALSQLIWRVSYWNDDKYMALTLVSLAFCLYLLGAFAPKGFLQRILGRKAAAAPVPAATTP